MGPIKEKYEVGIVGLGTIGRNLFLNAVDHGFAVAGYDLDPSKQSKLQAEAGESPVYAAPDIDSLVAALRRPRAILVFVPAGPPVDAVIAALLTHLEKGDLIVDGGNSHFKDTDRRAKSLAEEGIGFLGLGVSGGERGARYGPSLMAGGQAEYYRRLQPMFEAIAAQAEGEPCAALLGPGSAGHYVKIVHNGIEYGLIQLLAEAYDLLKRGLGLGNEELAEIFSSWNQDELNGFLVETTARIFRVRDESSDGELIDAVLDVAGQMGTGAWVSEEALALGSPAPTIDAAVWMRSLSGFKAERVAAAQILPGPSGWFIEGRDEVLRELQDALYTGMVLTFAQGLALLWVASSTYGYGLELEEVARIWRAGSIIRVQLLEEVRSAYRRTPELPHLLQDPKLASSLGECIPGLRAIVSFAAQAGLPAPGFSGALAYLDAYRSAWLPANLIQALRDDFGAHGYERTDQPGIFHTNWGER